MTKALKKQIRELVANQLREEHLHLARCLDFGMDFDWINEQRNDWGWHSLDKETFNILSRSYKRWRVNNPPL